MTSNKIKRKKKQEPIPITLEDLCLKIIACMNDPRLSEDKTQYQLIVPDKTYLLTIDESS